MEDTLVLTPSALLTLLSQVEELKDLDLAIDEEEDGITIKIGENIYKLESPKEVEVDSEVVEAIDDINEECYDELAEEVEVDELTEIEGDLVEGGIIKELIKTLAVGGLVRLTKDAILKS